MKRLLSFALCLSLPLLIALPEWTARAAWAAKTLKVHHSGLDEPSRDSLGAMGRVFKNLMETGGNGELRVTILAAGVLGTDAEVLRHVQAGHIQSALLDAEAVTALYPPLEVLELPFALPDAPTAVAVLDGPFGQKLAADIRRATGLIVLGFGDAEGFVQFTAPKRDFVGPQGLAIAPNGTQEAIIPPADPTNAASTESPNVPFPAEPQPAPRIGVTQPAHARLVERLGGKPVLLASSELFPALQDGRIHGTAGTITNLSACRVGEAQKYLLLAEALFSPTVWVVNAEFWDDLSHDERLLVFRAARTALMAGRGMTRSMEASEHGLPALRAVMKPVILSPETRVTLRDAAIPAMKTLLDAVAVRFPEAPALLEAYVQAARSGTELWYAPIETPAEAPAPEAPSQISPAPSTTPADATRSPAPSTPAES